MKNINLKALSLGVALSVLAGCQTRLEVLPEQSIATSQAFANKSNAQASLLGVYSQAQLLDAFGSGPQIIQDFQADNTEFVGSFPTLQDINNYVTTSPNATIQAHWQVHYRAINGANAVIDNVPGINDAAFTDKEKNQVVAEAKFMRGVLYLSLVNMFAQPFQVNNGGAPGVPLVLKSFTSEVEFPARATVAEVHQQIIKDLTEALPNLPDVTTPQSRGRATKGAANGYLARIHLLRGEFQKAAEFANEVVKASSTYSLATNYGFYGAAPSSEHVFVLVNSATDNGRTGSGGWASYHRPAAQGGRGDAAFSADLEKAFAAEAGDKRFTELSDVVTAADNQRRRMTLKFKDAATNTDLAPLMRTSEMYLTRAEALAELNGINEESIKLVNPIRVRAGLTPWTMATFTTKEAFVNAILLERRKELAFEGHRRMDLLRRKLPLRTTGTPSVVAAAAFGAPKTILPIPQREVDLNKNLKQNEGY